MTADSPDLDRLEAYAQKVQQIGGGGFKPASLMPQDLLALIAELRQARAERDAALAKVAAVQDALTHAEPVIVTAGYSTYDLVAAELIRDALALHGVPHEWVETTRMGSRNLEYVCAHCDQTRTEPRPDCTTDQEDTSP